MLRIKLSAIIFVCRRLELKIQSMSNELAETKKLNKELKTVNFFLIINQIDYRKTSNCET